MVDPYFSLKRLRTELMGNFCESKSAGRSNADQAKTLRPSWLAHKRPFQWLHNAVLRSRFLYWGVLLLQIA